MPINTNLKVGTTWHDSENIYLTKVSSTTYLCYRVPIEANNPGKWEEDNVKRYFPDVKLYTNKIEGEMLKAIITSCIRKGFPIPSFRTSDRCKICQRTF